MKLVTILMIAALTSGVSPAQEGSHVGPPRTFTELVQRSDLIIEALVNEVSISEKYGSRTETYSSVSVQRVFMDRHGALTSGTEAVALFQFKEKTPTGYELFSQDPLVKSGERYILFLTQISKQPRLKNFGLPVYSAVGYYIGKAAVTEQNTIQFLPAAVAPFHSFDGFKIETFVAILEEEIKTDVLR